MSIKTIELLPASHIQIKRMFESILVTLLSCTKRQTKSAHWLVSVINCRSPIDCTIVIALCFGWRRCMRISQQNVAYILHFVLTLLQMWNRSAGCCCSGLLIATVVIKLVAIRLKCWDSSLTDLLDSGLFSSILVDWLIKLRRWWPVSKNAHSLVLVSLMRINNYRLQICRLAIRLLHNWIDMWNRI